MNLTLMPVCVGFIMDGNRRWARGQNLPVSEGHRAGVHTLNKMIETIKELEIPHAVFYAFSTENWQRAPEEVSVLLSIFLEVLQKESSVKVCIIGQREKFSKELQRAMMATEKKTASIKNLTIWIALSYGGRAEIIDATNTAIRNGKAVDELSFQKLFWSAEMPDPDLIIRTGGEQRLSNFLPWQSVYSELFFTKTFWPAFTKNEFISILEEYGKRQRRHGQ
jgi:undecaprenyl diphosphate synthase